MSDLQKFKEVIGVPYKDQAIFFLNAFWPEHQSQAEQVWKYVQKVSTPNPLACPCKYVSFSFFFAFHFFLIFFIFI